MGYDPLRSFGGKNHRDIDYKDYPQEVIMEMKRLGLPKPHDCHSRLWDNRKEMNHKHETIIELMLAGWPIRKIADYLEWDRHALSHLVLTPTFKAAYADARKQRRESLDKAAISELYQKATEVVEKVMMNEDEKGSTRLDAAKYVIDQTVGKPEQKVHQTGSILHEVLSRVEELKSRPVTEATENIDSTKNAIDTFIDENIPEGFSVGQRGGTDESTREQQANEPESRVSQRSLNNSDFYS